MRNDDLIYICDEMPIVEANGWHLYLPICRDSKKFFSPKGPIGPDSDKPSLIQLIGLASDFWITVGLLDYTSGLIARINLTADAAELKIRYLRAITAWLPELISISSQFRYFGHPEYSSDEDCNWLMNVCSCSSQLGRFCNCI